ncbi:MAG: PDZ domain-containing protein [Pseudomonadales bacterium]|nr:PDZ domain-containing protein [Pseudomonadales bacterium]
MIALSRTALLFFACSLGLAGCVGFSPRELSPTLTLSGEIVDLGPTASNTAAGGADLGMTLSINESDSLTNITVLPGTRVRTVAPGSAAELAGIRPGDIILSIDDRATDHPDVIAALALQIEEPTSLQLQVRRNTTVYETTLEAAPQRAASTPVELYRADPLLTRAGYTTSLLSDSAGQNSSGARIHTLLAESPLPAAGLQTGDIILSLNDMAVSSAQGLITLAHGEFTPGQRVDVSYLRNGRIQNTSVRLWSPGRKLSRLSLWPLLDYRASVNPDSSSLDILDLWLFSVFSYQQQGGERSWQALGLFRSETGFGELQEVSP